MTKEEKVKMYMKCSKRVLAEMLINANVALESRPLQITYPANPPGTWNNIQMANTGTVSFCEMHPLKPKFIIDKSIPKIFLD